MRISVLDTNIDSGRMHGEPSPTVVAWLDAHQAQPSCALSDSALSKNLTTAFEPRGAEAMGLFPSLYLAGERPIAENPPQSRGRIAQVPPAILLCHPPRCGRVAP